MNKATIAGRIYHTSHITGRFTLRSGQVSEEYFDKYLFEADPKLLADIACVMRPLVPDTTQVLAGLEMGGIPVVTALSLRSGLPAAFVRKKAKEYGTCKLAEGADVEGKRVTVIEDVVTTGGQIVESVRALRERGALVSDVLCVILRDERAHEILAAEGLRLTPAFTMAYLACCSRQLAMRWAESTLPEMPQPEGVEIRPFRPDEIDALIDALVPLHGSRMSREDLDRIILCREGVRPEGVFVAVLDGKIVGTTTGYFNPPSVEGGAIDSGTIHMVSALPEAAGRGIGAALCLRTMRYLADNGCREIVLTTDDFRLPAISVYRKLGFAPIIEAGDTVLENRWHDVWESLQR